MKYSNKALQHNSFHIFLCWYYYFLLLIINFKCNLSHISFKTIYNFQGGFGQFLFKIKTIFIYLMYPALWKDIFLLLNKVWCMHTLACALCQEGIHLLCCLLFYDGQSWPDITYYLWTLFCWWHRTYVIGDDQLWY